MSHACAALETAFVRLFADLLILLLIAWFQLGRLQRLLAGALAPPRTR